MYLSAIEKPGSIITFHKYLNEVDSDFNQAIENEGGKDLSMANTNDDHKKMGWVEMNRINKLKSHINHYHKL